MTDLLNQRESGAISQRAAFGPSAQCDAKAQSSAVSMSMLSRASVTTKGMTPARTMGRAARANLGDDRLNLGGQWFVLRLEV
jgi:hypothetical protein